MNGGPSDGLAGIANPLGRHLIIDRFLGTEERDALFAWVLTQADAFMPSRIGGGRVDEAFRSSSRLPRAIFAPWVHRLRCRFEAQAPHAAATLGIGPFALAGISIDLVQHRDGDFYRRHVDVERQAARAPGERMISMVYYFHALPKRFSGGVLRLYPSGEGAAPHDVAPEDDRLVIFSPHCLHEVLPVVCPSGAFADARFSINCWIHAA